MFAAGEDCNDVWVINANGDKPRKISAKVSGGADFTLGVFSWSRDGRSISHASCTKDGDRSSCGGGYWDISSDGRTARRGGVAGSVLREQRPLIRPVKVRIEIDGPIRYNARMQVGSQSVGQHVGRSNAQLLEATASDENDPTRTFELKLHNPADSSWVAGSLRIVDGDVDETFTFFGRALLASYGYAKVRGVWLRTGGVPLQSGQLVMTLER